MHIRFIPPFDAVVTAEQPPSDDELIFPLAA